MPATVVSGAPHGGRLDLADGSTSPNRGFAYWEEERSG
jgi:hypothetical protein